MVKSETSDGVALDGLMAGGSLPVYHSLAGVYVSLDAEISALVEPASSSIPMVVDASVKKQDRTITNRGSHRSATRLAQEDHVQSGSGHSSRGLDQGHVRPCEQRSSPGIFKATTVPDERVVNISAGKP